MDLRMFDSHSWFRGSPWRESPREPNEQRIMERVVRPRDVAYDIGANLGLHMALLSRCVGAAGRVYAFEPNPALVRLLRLTAHEAGNCVLHNVALGDVEETAMLFVPDDHSMASLANWTNGRCGRTRQVRCDQVKLDHLIAEGLQPPDFIKCDVEGAELKVFTGARQTLDRSAAPIVLFEAGENTSKGFGLQPQPPCGPRGASGQARVARAWPPVPPLGRRPRSSAPGSVSTCSAPVCTGPRQARRCNSPALARAS